MMPNQTNPNNPSFLPNLGHSKLNLPFYQALNKSNQTFLFNKPWQEPNQTLLSTQPYPNRTKPSFLLTFAQIIPDLPFYPTLGKLIPMFTFRHIFGQTKTNLSIYRALAEPNQTFLSIQTCKTKPNFCISTDYWPNQTYVSTQPLQNK